VDEAESGEAGIASAFDAAPDLVLCDIMMPGIDGFGVLEALRARPETALTPFIFLTAKAGGRDVRLGMNQGADDYITKPFDPDALLASARQRLSRRRLQQEEARRSAANAGMSAAAVLPREMEDCMSHLESLSEALSAVYGGDQRAGEIRRSMQEDVARLRGLAQRLRLYSELPSLYARRFSGDRLEPAQSSFEVAARTARETAGRWSRVADLDVQDQPGTVPLPAESLGIFVRELVDNACKFSPASTRVCVGAGPEKGYWKMVVTDRGSGMRADQIQEIGAFKQFWNGSERPRGLGIGLVLVQTLARLHGGEVQIESAEASGTRVSVLMPVE
jgi:CheY-like chemotaxis protein/anti-sigma regulatory factor (Ser/Thr protein kinase)